MTIPKVPVVTGPISICPCTQAGLKCISNVCVDDTSIFASLLTFSVSTPNMIYSAFSLWDTSCNPYSVPPSALNHSIVVQERSDPSLPFINVSQTESFYGLASDSIPTESHVLLLVDLSGSVQASIEQVRAALVAFVNATVDTNSTKLQIAIFGFLGGEKLVEISPYYSNDYEAILRTVKGANLNCSFDAGQDCSTNLYGAIVSALSVGNFTSGNATTAVAGLIRYDFLVVFSDGTDRANRASLSDVSVAMEGAAVVVYGVVVPGETDAELFNTLTPGGVYEVSGPSELAGRFAEVAASIAALSGNVYVALHCAAFRGGSVALQTLLTVQRTGYVLTANAANLSAVAGPLCTRANATAPRDPAFLSQVGMREGGLCAEPRKAFAPLRLGPGSLLHSQAAAFFPC